jgi:hypothetical protein
MTSSTVHHKPGRATVAAGLASSCAALCSIVSFFLVSIYASEAHAQVLEYKSNVFTNQGQGTVKEFEEKLKKVADTLRKIPDLKVYVGYHADPNGLWCVNFDTAEQGDVLQMAALFPKAKLTWLSKDLSDDEIRNAVKAGNVFFTWCDSDKRVKAVMGSAMPARK